MATKKKLLEAAAGAAGGAGGLNVEDVFSTYLYKGTDSTQTITNGIDLDGEGGLVWLKSRGFTNTNTNLTGSHALIDTERGNTSRLLSNTTNAAQSDGSNYVNSFNSDGFTVGTTMSNGFDGGHRYASWTFRKAPKFFDVVTWTGNTGNRTISHSLNGEVGMIVLKKTSATGDWYSYHRSLGNTTAIALNSTGAAISPVSFWQSTTPTSTEFYVNSDWNDNGQTYVAYLFAHNDGDGDFGSTADQDIIKCGSYTGDGTDYQKIDLGFEAQWVMTKAVTRTSNWDISDNMRELTTDNHQRLEANSYNAEYNETFKKVYNNGFMVSGNNLDSNAASHTYIYIAIRRGPMAVPESATDVFEANSPAGSSSTSFKSGNTSGSLLTDFFIGKPRITVSGISWVAGSRLTSKLHYPNLTAAEESTTFFEFDTQSGFNWVTDWVTTADSEYLTYHWRRAPGFMDAVAYTGNDTAGHTISHNLGVTPEMIWVKSRSSTLSWFCYHSALTSNGAILLNSNGASFTGTTYWNNTNPTASDFTLGTSINVNGPTFTYIAYLFATLPGISKVGSYTGNGSTQNIDCGFSSGARFVLIKRTDSTGDWYVWDAERGIVSANDPHLSLNTTAAEVTTDDSVDPVSSGFAVNQVAATNINVSSASYIYYAVS